MLETNEQLIVEQLPGAKDHILSVAIEVFSTQGYRSASVFEIVQKSGLNQAAFKQYFSSKRDIFLALIEKYYTEYAELLERYGIIQVPDLDMAATLMMGSASAIIEEYVINGKKHKPEALAEQLLGYFVRAMAPAGSNVDDLVRRLNAKSRKKPKTKKMPVLEIDNDISVEVYFDKAIRKIFRDQVRSTNLANLHGSIITLQFVIHGKEDLTYGLRVDDGTRMEVIHGPMDKAMITLEMSEKVYRQALKGKVAEALQTAINLNQIADRRRYDQIRGLKGSLTLELLLEDGTVLPFKLIFNGARMPAALFRLSLDDYIAMGKGELYGMSAFVSGRLEVEGDKPFAMQLSNLMR